MTPAHALSRPPWVAEPGRDEANASTTSAADANAQDDDVSDAETATHRAARLQDCWQDRIARAAAVAPDPLGKLTAPDRPDCADLGRITYQRLRNIWSKAATLGSREAQYHFAAEPLFNPTNPAGDLEYLRDWHDRAPGYMAAAAEQGQPRAALSLALAADAERDAFPSSDDDPGEGPLAWWPYVGQAQAANAATAYRYYLLTSLLANDLQPAWVSASLARLGAELTPAQMAEAQQWAQAAAQRAGATPR